jgi:molybdate transport system substrate-binding protein
MRRRAGVWAVVAVLVVGCSGGGLTSAPSGAPGGSETTGAGAALTIFGAASLARVLGDVEAAYEAEVPGGTLTLSTDSSTTLATQISEGAPADVFLSADTTNPQRLVEAGVVDGEASVFAANELTIITPLDELAGLRDPFDLGRPGVRVIAAGDEVPITTYAGQLVEALAASPGAPPDFAAAYAANVVSKEDNVAAVRTKIELGEGDAAIVYATDAAASARVATIDVPDAMNVRASYAGVVLASSADVGAAHAFVDWLVGPDGQAILARHGFLPPPP